jgi:hypothetical protein
LKVVDLNGTLDAEADATKSNIHYEQLKVDDLRKVVADFGLASKDEVKKLKKPELLVLLKKILIKTIGENDFSEISNSNHCSRQFIYI